jgi:hypothetical protein
MIRILEDNNQVAEILEKEWGCLPPHPQFGDIVAIEENGEIKAFLSREMLIHVGTIWVNPNDRNTMKGANWLHKLIKYAILNMPKGSSALVMDEPGTFGKLMHKLGLYPIKANSYRIDFSDI